MDEQVRLGHQLLDLVDELIAKLGTKICQKLKRRILAELNFLEQLRQRVSAAEVESCHAGVNSSNLPFLRGVLQVAKVSDHVVDVLTHFRSHDVSIDVICEGGHKWVKVIARNPQALHLVWAGRGQFGDRDLLQKASKYIAAAKNYRPVHPPQVEFHFCSAVTHQMSARLEALGISIVGQRVDVAEDVCRRLKMTGLDASSGESDGELDTASGDSDDSGDESNCGSTMAQTNCGCQSSTAGQQHMTAAAAATHGDRADVPLCSTDDCRTCVGVPNDSVGGGSVLAALAASPLSYTDFANIVPSRQPRLFLDITALVALASELTHGGCYFVFCEQVLTEQAADERATPALPTMERYMSGKELITCTTAMEDFVKIVSVLGGRKEAERAKALLKTVAVVSDCMSQRTARLQISSRIKHRSKVIFGTADSLGCDILTANSGFVRAAAGQGVNYSAFLHPSRALTEKKEGKSSKLPPLPLPPPEASVLEPSN